MLLPAGPLLQASSRCCSRKSRYASPERSSESDGEGESAAAVAVAGVVAVDDAVAEDVVAAVVVTVVVVAAVVVEVASGFAVRRIWPWPRSMLLLLLLWELTTTQEGCS